MSDRRNDRDKFGSPSTANRINRICDAFKQKWVQGERPDIESFLSHSSKEDRAILLKELLAVEVEYRRSIGEQFKNDEYLNRFPDETDAVKSTLTIMTENSHRDQSLQLTVITAQLQEDSSVAPAERSPTSTQASSQLPWQFSNYELIGEIARGGMGVVYQARDKQLKRIVAIKLILAGQFTSQKGKQRFQREAEAAAQLDHPNIVPIYEVGEDQGRQFLAMGFVDGNSLAHKVADAPLGSREAAELIQQIALAIEYAHEKGIVHRDLKPDNILIASDGTPKVTDFGLAKQTDDQDSLTATGDILGTPGYMPPEQAQGRIDDVGPLSDIYSLGAVLYCLLTGRPPFQAASILEVLKQVNEREPVAIRDLSPDVDLDLETICLKCLQKEPVKRYLSAGEMAIDVERYLNGEPIQARPVSIPERTWRWCRRNPVVSSLVVGLVLTLATGTIVSTVLAINAQRSADDAQRSAKKAQQSAAIAEKERDASQKALRENMIVVDDFFTKVSEADAFVDNPELEPLRNELVGSALQYYEKFVATERPDQQDFQVAIAAAHFRLGRVKYSLKRKDEWIPEVEKGLEIVTQLLKRDIPYEEIKPLEGTYRARGQTTINTPSDLNHTVQILNTMAERYEEVCTKYPQSAGFKSDLSGMYHLLADFQRVNRNETASLEAFNKAERILETLVSNHKDNADYHFQLALHYRNKSRLLRQQTMPREAELEAKKSIKLMHTLTARLPDNPYYNDALASTQIDLSYIFFAQKRIVEAKAVIEEAIKIREAIVREYPAKSEFKVSLARFYNDYAYKLAGVPFRTETPEFKVAVGYAKKAWQLITPLLDAAPQNNEYSRIWIRSGKLVFRGYDEFSNMSSEEYARHLRIVNRLPNIHLRRGELTKALYAKARMHLLNQDENSFQIANGILLKELINIHAAGFSSRHSGSWRLVICLYTPGALNDFSAAHKLAEQISIDDTIPYGKQALGMSLYRIGRYDEASKILDEVVGQYLDGRKVNELHIMAPYFLAMSYHQNGDRDRAQDVIIQTEAWVSTHQEEILPTGMELLEIVKNEAEALVKVSPEKP